eukprot:TRINITY_DN12296_c0_g4_i2.p1 TRINITY_DN12296_c0_g4~~TRINITY_DN12296_c0_g4_i2.p1  ORF type:complete len:623 (+),score=135.66 TRINITY_DN12296_c0_g4_i2:251-1870(+)
MAGRAGNLTKRLQSWQANPNSQARQAAGQDQTKPSMRQLNRRVRVEAYSGPKLRDNVANKVTTSNRKMDAGRIRTSDKSDRATTEQVLDPRTRMMLFQLLSRGLFDAVNGCISTGKEANVYHASSDDQTREYAIKVYKTSILVFKDRDKYVTGEFRFRHGYSKHNPRKMVKTWAEKEYRNLARLRSGGIPCPEPIALKAHIVVMEFLGMDGWPSPRLKDATFSKKKAKTLYHSCITLMRQMYQTCKLVHGDLSEYNMLYHQGSIIIIDVSQAVEQSHPHALEFLRRDCANVNDFFKRHDVGVMEVRDLFDFITDVTITDDNVDEYLEAVQDKMRRQELQAQEDPEAMHAQEVEAGVFQRVFIPGNLDDVMHLERDLEFANKGKTDLLYYQKVTGMREDMSGAATEPELLLEYRQRQQAAALADSTATENRNQSASEAAANLATEDLSQPATNSSSQDPAAEGIGNEEGEYSEGQDDDDDDGEYDGNGDAARAIPDFNSMSKAERKKAVKEFNRERRANKTKKHVKKRKSKLAKQRRGNK